MPAISTSVSVFWTKDFGASSTGTPGAPLKLQCIGAQYEIGAEFTIFTDDQALTDRLVVAINEAVAAHKAMLAAATADAA